MSGHSESGGRPVKRTRSTAAPLSLLRDSNRSATQTRETATTVKKEMLRKKRRTEDTPAIRSEDEENEGGDANDEEEDDSGPISSAHRGTVRNSRIASIEGDGGEEENGDDEEQEEEEEDEAAVGPSMQSARSTQVQRSVVRASDGFTPGSIVRVKLQRFVTYNSVEFRPGPHLNMVIGPNGTGKSSIVCAIALGLGWKPAVLGRAKDVAAFVKQGFEDATIELELKAGVGQRENVILERRIFTKDNRSEWRLNGKKAIAKDIQDKVDEFNINVGNLCCFLPQDKVADFARMSPADLLKETQKAAGAADMSSLHMKLTQYGAQQRDLAARLLKERTEVDNLQERNEVLHRDVRRAEERQRIVEEIETLQLEIPFARYQTAKDLYDSQREIRNDCKTQLMDAKKTLEPLKSRLVDMQERFNEEEQEIKRLQKTIGKDTPTFKKLHEALDEHEIVSQRLSDNLSSVRKTEQESKRKIADLARRVQNLEEAVREEPPRPDNRQFDAQIRATREQMREMRTEDSQCRSEQEEIGREVQGLQRESDTLRKTLEEMANVKTARLDSLAKHDLDTYKAVKWLRGNQSLFREKVFEPVLLELSIEDRSFASAVEMCINWAAMKTFVCQTRADYDLFTRTLVDEMKLRLNVVELENGKSLKDYLKPVSEDELRRLGFDRFIVDCIEAPDPVLEFLCDQQYLHMIPYAKDARAVNVEEIEAKGRFKRYIVGSHMSTITLSSYGNRLPQTLTRDLRPARNLVNSVDQSRKRELDRRIQEIGEKTREYEGRVQSLIKKQATLEKNVEQLKQQQQSLEQRKGAANVPRTKWEKDMVVLHSAKAELAKEKSKPTAEEQTKVLSAELGKVNKKSQEVVKQVMALMQQQVRLRSQADEASLQQLQKQEKVMALSMLKEEQESEYRELEQTAREAQEKMVEAKETATKLRERAQDLVDEAPEDVVERFKERSESTTRPPLAELEAKLAQEEAKLEFLIAVRPGVMEEYNARRRKIESLNKTIQTINREKEKIDARVTSLEQRWVTALTELVDNVSMRFSRAFQAIGNAGEVRIAKHEDYDQWGIEILVKFRDNEQLQLLTASRQSGGERSISTITYLLSLTEMSRSPFSLVDEINQGMDQKYERQVHNHMVNVTCKEDAGQYFLITPKLLPNLSYDERMKVLIVNNGEWIPDNGFDFAKYIRQRRTEQHGSVRLPARRAPPPV